MEYASQVNMAGAARAAERSIAVDMQYGSALGSAEVDQRGDLQYITDRINECIDRASSCAERVSLLADRVKGQTPECSLNEKLASAGPGAVNEIHARLDLLMNALGAVGSNIARIERL